MLLKAVVVGVLPRPEIPNLDDGVHEMTMFFRNWTCALVVAGSVLLAA